MSSLISRRASISSDQLVSVAVLVLSCDRYSDLWAPFMAQFERYWPDCRLRRYITSNHLRADFSGFETLALGDDVSWSDNLSRALGMIHESYVLLFLEDLILHAPVDRALLDYALGWVSANEPDQIKLNATERPDERIDGNIGRVREGAIYRTSTVLTLWKKEVLLSLLEPGESAWAFEIDGSARSDAFPHFYSMYRDCFPVTNCVIKGKWRRTAVRELAAQGTGVDLEKRMQMTLFEDCAFRAKELGSWVFKLIPIRHRRVVRSIFLGAAH